MSFIQITEIHLFQLIVTNFHIKSRRRRRHFFYKKKENVNPKKLIDMTQILRENPSKTLLSLLNRPEALTMQYM